MDESLEFVKHENSRPIVTLELLTDHTPDGFHHRPTLFESETVVNRRAGTLLLFRVSVTQRGSVSCSVPACRHRTWLVGHAPVRVVIAFVAKSKIHDCSI